MRILLSALAILLLKVSAFGQAPNSPAQGPPPKNLIKQSDGHVSANGLPANPDKFETHVVVAGDTLSQIADMVLKDSRLWPQLWEMNEHIVNPHWIYPDDKILIRPITIITEATPPAAAEAPAPAPVAEVIAPPALPPVPASVGIAVLRNLIAPNSAASQQKDVFDTPAPRLVSGIKTSDVYCSGFVRSAPVSSALKISATFQRPALMSTEGEYVYLSQGTNGGVKPGSTYQVIRPTTHVSDTSRPGNLGELGTHYLDIGQVQIIQVMENSALARVFGNCDAIKLGDVLIPFVHYDLPELPRNRPFSPTMVSKDVMAGYVVLMKNAVVGSVYKTSSRIPTAGSIVGEGEIVYINLSKGDGLKSGDIFIVYHEKTAVGEITILKVDDKASTALVTYSTNALVLGDRVERR